jgi:hypothetical protein
MLRPGLSADPGRSILRGRGSEAWQPILLECQPRRSFGARWARIPPDSGLELAGSANQRLAMLGSGPDELPEAGHSHKDEWTVPNASHDDLRKRPRSKSVRIGAQLGAGG